jgi:hypothetical protein
MAFPPRQDHAITLEAAAALTRRYRETAGPGAQRAAMFPRAVFEALLALPGCAGIRIYNGQSEKGTRESILVGVDGEGNDMTSATLFDYGLPCPPYCGGGDVLNGDGA